MNEQPIIKPETGVISRSQTASDELLAALGIWVINLWRPPLEFFSDAVAVIWQSCRPVTWRRPVRSKFVSQCYEIGTRALPFIMVSGIFGGFGIVAQSLYWLEAFGGKALFGGFPDGRSGSGNRAGIW